jgi:drug/metabolite transporter (DMT)-like permease
MSAFLFGLSTPLAKLLLGDIPPVALAGFLYLGAFLGLIVYSGISRRTPKKAENGSPSLQKKDVPWLIGAIVAGGVIAPISLMMGLNLISGFTTSLLLNLEGVCTAIIAILIFRENSGKKLWLALLCMTAAGVLLSWDPAQSKFNITGPLLILLATFCWGIDNNLTRQIADKNPVQITWIKGLAAGTTSLSIAMALGLRVTLDITILYALLLGSLSYGLSLVFFIKALQGLGSSRSGAFFSLGPFIGALVSLVLFKNWNAWLVLPSFALMVFGVWLIVNEKHVHSHTHLAITHNHRHKHDDLHHLHGHQEPVNGSHDHEHAHPEMTHTHAHWPDISHRHAH